MNKALSITIAGQVFQIEEDAYQTLRAYLDQIQRYFSSYEDSREIVYDIECRLAEIFKARVVAGQRQAIIMSDVEFAIASIGTIEQIAGEEASMADETASTGSTAGASSGYAGTGQQGYGNWQQTGNPGQAGSFNSGRAAFDEGHGPSRLYRIVKGKMLGGVLSGLADYFGIDVSWVRILFLALFFGIWLLPAISAVLIVGYVFLWFLLPAKLESTYRPARRLFRDPYNKVLGGVAAGLARYLDVDPMLVRVLFVILVLAGGTGIALYLILWAATPAAYTPKQQMEMKGTPFTINNLQENIGQFNYDFKAKSLAPVWRFGAVVLGAILLGIGVAFAVGAAFPIFGSDLGIDTSVRMDGEEIGNLLQAPTWARLALWALLGIPGLLLILVGIRLITRLRFLRGWMLAISATLWVVALVATVFAFLPIAQKLDNEPRAQNRQISQVPSAHKRYMLVAGTGLQRLRTSVEITFHPAYIDSITVTEWSKGNGVFMSQRSPLSINVIDSVITIHNREKRRSRNMIDIGTDVAMEIHIPVNTEFMVNAELLDALDFDQLRTLTVHDNVDFHTEASSLVYFFDKQGNLQYRYQNQHPHNADWEDGDEDKEEKNEDKAGKDTTVELSQLPKKAPALINEVKAAVCKVTAQAAEHPQAKAMPAPTLIGLIAGPAIMQKLNP